MFLQAPAGNDVLAAAAAGAGAQQAANPNEAGNQEDQADHDVGEEEGGEDGNNGQGWCVSITTWVSDMEAFKHLHVGDSPDSLLGKLQHYDGSPFVLSKRFERHAFGSTTRGTDLAEGRSPLLIPFILW